MASSLPLSSYSPTDVFVLVGGQLFRAHRCILATNSGYFKSLLDADVDHASLSLPGLPSRAFSVLLDFMYSGHLATTGANIYEVLLCAQFLHMPRAIDLCKAYLVHQQQQQELTVNSTTPPLPGHLNWLTLSPLAYKAWLADSIYTRCLDSVSLLRPPANILRPIPTKRAVAPMLPTFPKENEQCSSSCQPYPTAPSTSRIALTRVDMQTNAGSDVPSFTWTRPDFSPARPAISEIPKKVSHEDGKECSNETHDDDLPCSSKKTSQLVALASATVTATSNVVIDIACCDGPVQFQRVINENYGLVCTLEPISTFNESCDEKSDKFEKLVKVDINKKCDGGSSTSALSHNPNITILQCPSSASEKIDTSVNNWNFNAISPLHQPQGQTSSAELHKEDGEKSPPLNPTQHPTPTSTHGHSSSEGSGWTDSDNDTREQSGSDITAKDTTDTPGVNKLTSISAYHCVYCNHTFKSRYCYQKHKQRHINPKAFAGPALKPKLKEPAAPLDMNVPFYPCKICGSKFPSYYFVHKHRKLCHCDERLWTDESTTSSNSPEKE